METLLIKIHKFEGLEKPQSKFFVLRVFTVLFAIVTLSAALTSIFGDDSLFEKDQEQPVTSEGDDDRGGSDSGGETADQD